MDLVPCVFHNVTLSLIIVLNNSRADSIRVKEYKSIRMSCILFKCSVLINFVLLEITYYPWGLDNFFSGEDTKS